MKWIQWWRVHVTCCVCNLYAYIIWISRYTPNLIRQHHAALLPVATRCACNSHANALSPAPQTQTQIPLPHRKSPPGFTRLKHGTMRTCAKTHTHVTARQGGRGSKGYRAALFRARRSILMTTLGRLGPFSRCSRSWLPSSSSTPRPAFGGAPNPATPTPKPETPRVLKTRPWKPRTRNLGTLEPWNFGFLDAGTRTSRVQTRRGARAHAQQET